MTVYICHTLDSLSTISLRDLSFCFGKNIIDVIGIIICFRYLHHHLLGLFFVVQQRIYT